MYYILYNSRDLGGLAIAEQRFKANGDERYTLRYTFDESNSPIGFDIKYPNESTWAYYYFVKNAQGDVVAMYHWYEPGKAYLVCTYEYDPWGKLLSVKNSSGTALASTTYHVSNYNPFRYRSYYYDIDTELYYLQSRYYDPAIGRFINSDAYVSTGQGLLGYNMFAYCRNNPICRKDSSGSREINAMTVSGESAADRHASCKAQTDIARQNTNYGGARNYKPTKGRDDFGPAKYSPNCYAYAIGERGQINPGDISGKYPANTNDVQDVGNSVEVSVL